VKNLYEVSNEELSKYIKQEIENSIVIKEEIERLETKILYGDSSKKPIGLFPRSNKYQF